MRLIDADALKRWLEINKANVNPLDYNTKATYAECIMMVENSETIEAEPVVRCKDCKHFMFGDYCMHDGVMEHSHARENDFCSYGERRAADEDENELD